APGILMPAKLLLLISTGFPPASGATVGVVSIVTLGAVFCGCCGAAIGVSETISQSATSAPARASRPSRSTSAHWRTWSRHPLSVCRRGEPPLGYLSSPRPVVRPCPLLPLDSACLLCRRP